MFLQSFFFLTFILKLKALNFWRKIFLNVFFLVFLQMNFDFLLQNNRKIKNEK
jgi:hypothetical protein